MWQLENDFIVSYTEAVAQAFTAFVPVWGAIVGLFIAFAIANMIRFFISRSIKG